MPSAFVESMHAAIAIADEHGGPTYALHHAGVSISRADFDRLAARLVGFNSADLVALAWLAGTRAHALADLVPYVPTGDPEFMPDA